MAYSASISRANPSCFFFVIDQSASMSDRMLTETKADYVGRVLNRTLQDLVLRCSKDEGIRDYFHIGIVGYHGDSVENGLGGELASKFLQPISAVNDNPVRVEDVMQKVPDGAGGILEMNVKFPVWYEPKATGGTPMCAALNMVAAELATWCDTNPKSFPPVVMHLTDGMATDGNPEELSEMLSELGTDDGNVVLMNIHVDELGGVPISFPATESELPNNSYAQQLFRMSSAMPPKMIELAKEFGFGLQDGARGYIYQGKAEEIVRFFEIGTRGAELR